MIVARQHRRSTLSFFLPVYKMGRVLTPPAVQLFSGQTTSRQRQGGETGRPADAESERARLQRMTDGSQTAGAVSASHSGVQQPATSSNLIGSHPRGWRDG